MQHAGWLLREASSSQLCMPVANRHPKLSVRPHRDWEGGEASGMRQRDEWNRVIMGWRWGWQIKPGKGVGSWTVVSAKSSPLSWPQPTFTGPPQLVPVISLRQVQVDLQGQQRPSKGREEMFPFLRGPNLPPERNYSGLNNKTALFKNWLQNHKILS